MTYREEKRDLFSVPDDYYLAQCISADFGMGMGIAVEFNKRFDMKSKLVSRYTDWLRYWDMTEEQQGTCLLEGRVFNLITKRNYWQKPTYITMTGALQAMAILAKNNNVKKIAMPKIGCGLDRLKWNTVSILIQAAFADMDIETLVCVQ
jgi:O-acetyl-ADP-ribose deacetylase (regulator of RNase III)